MDRVYCINNDATWKKQRAITFSWFLKFRCIGHRHGQSCGARERSCSWTKEDQSSAGEESHIDPGLDYGRLHCLLVALFLPLLTRASLSFVQHSAVGFRLRFLARLHQLGSESSESLKSPEWNQSQCSVTITLYAISGHLYHFQQRLPASVSTHHLPMHYCPLLSPWTVNGEEMKESLVSWNLFGIWQHIWNF